MLTPTTQYSIVLKGRYAGKDRSVAQALARAFGRDDAWGLQVVGGAPIIILDMLDAVQAPLIIDALKNVAAEGCLFEILQGLDPDISRVAWPAPPRIKGRLISEFTDPATMPLGQGPSTTMIVPCPYTGLLMKLTITVQLECFTPMDPTVSVLESSATARSYPAPVTSIPIPTPSSGFGARSPRLGALPQSHSMPSPKPPIQVPSRPLRHTPPHLPASAFPDFGMNAMDELMPLDELPSMSQARHGKPPVRGNPTLSLEESDIPLPDVPEVYDPIARPRAAAGMGPGSEQPAPMPMNLMNAPMELSVFEAKLSSSGIMKAVSLEEKPQTAAGDGADEENQGTLYSVFMGKSNNQRVCQLVSELHGLSVLDATRLCQRPIVALAKDLSSAQANEIKQQFSALNVNVRITKQKAL